jgi:hypothetical protein
MKCEDLQLDLSLYADNDLTEAEQVVVDGHLVQCPPCRVRLSELQALRNHLRIMSQPNVPADLLYSVRSAVRNEVVAPRNNWLNISSEWYEWLQFRFMPYAVGTAFSLFMTISFLVSLNSTQQTTEKVLETARVEANREVTSIQPVPSVPDDQLIITNEELAALRTPVSGESPSLNTKGALLSVTKSLVSNKIKEDDVTFVADVFSNGLAQITEVVEAPRSRQSLEEISNALENDPAYAPFVPADLDRRSNVVRVVFKIQRVDVFEKKPAKKKSLVRKL